MHSTTAKDAANEADVAEWFFHDGTHLTVKQEEHSSESALRGNERQAPKTKADFDVLHTLDSHQPLDHLLGHRRRARPHLLLGREQD